MSRLPIREASGSSAPPLVPPPPDCGVTRRSCESAAGCSAEEGRLELLSEAGGRPPAAEMLRRRSMAGEAGGGWAGAPTPESRRGLVQPAEPVAVRLPPWNAPPPPSSLWRLWSFGQSAKADIRCAEVAAAAAEAEIAEVEQLLQPAGGVTVLPLARPS